MNRKQLGLLIIVCLVIGGVGLLLSKRKQEDWNKSGQELGQKLLPDFAINDAALLRIKNHDTELLVAKKGDEWHVQQRNNYPAGYNEITDALRKLWDLKVAEPVEIERGQLWRLNLLPPDHATNNGTLVEIKDQAGKALAQLTLGKEFMKSSRSDSPFGGGSFPEGRYVMVGDDAKKVALVKDTLSTLAPNPSSWLSKDFFKVEKLKTITVTSTNATNNWKLTRDTEGGEWKLADAKGDEKADASKCSSLNWLLQSPSFTDVAIDWQFNETNKPITTATLETFDHFAYTVKLAPKGGSEDYYLQVGVSADIPKERTGATTNETAEVKEKLDKEFKEKTDKLKEKLKTEQALQPWTYIVSKWTVDTLFKDRKDFLAEKKEEPKTAETPKPPAGPPPPPPPLPPTASPADSLVPKLNEK
jgi:hypothetical protein